MLNYKFLNISFKTWIMIILTILYLIFKKKSEDFTSSVTSEKTISERCSPKSPNNNQKIKVYNFNTLWCGISRDFQPNWNTFSKDNKSNRCFSSK